MAGDYISCIAISLAYPLVRLCEWLDGTPFAGGNQLQTATNEHGRACSIVLLAVAMVESALNRARYVAEASAAPTRQSRGRCGKKGTGSALDFFRKHVAHPETANDLKEVYVLRDAIVHNHIWKAIVPDPGNLNDPRIECTLEPGYGDKKFCRCVDRCTAKTRRLSLNVVPARVSRQDAATVLRVAWAVCQALEMKDKRYFQLGAFPFPWSGSQTLTFGEIVALLDRNWRP